MIPNKFCQINNFVKCHFDRFMAKPEIELLVPDVHVDTYFFHTGSGDMLGTTKNVAAEKADDIGIRLMKEGKYDEARSYFNLAYRLCESGYRREGDFKRRVDEAEKAKRREMEAREREAREREAREREAQEKMQLELNAKSFYQQAQTLWDEAFNAELENSCHKAKSMFQRSYEQFSKAASLIPSNKGYKNWVNISALKLEGNVLFNEAVALQEEGSFLRKSQKYVEALQKYEEAKEKYLQALQMSDDTRFEACKEIVDECIKEIHEHMSKTALNEQMQRVQIDSSLRETDSYKEEAKQNEVKNESYYKVLDS